MLLIGLSPFPVIVTTRIITFLVGNPNLNLHFHYYWEGGQPKLLTWIDYGAEGPSISTHRLKCFLHDDMLTQKRGDVGCQK